MRILRVAQNLYPDVPGGGAYHVHAMSRDQAAMGHDVTVLTVTTDRDLPRREERDGYTVVRRRPTVTLLGNEVSLGVIDVLRDASDFDVVHAHSHLYFSTNVAAAKRRLSDVPLAITNHGLYSQSAPAWLFRAYLRTLGTWTFDSADVVFCYTDEDRDRIREFTRRAEIAVVPNGIDTRRFSPDGAASDRIQHDGPVVLFVGRLVDGKRPRDAVDAVGALPPELNAKLYVVGDGPLRGELERHVRDSGLGDRVEFVGQLPYDEMPRMYRSSDVLLLPSRAEGLPRTVLEAFASGLPAVTSRLDQLVPIVETDGATVEIGDVSGYAEAIETVLERTDVDGSKGRQLVVDEYRWQDTVERTTDVLRSIR